MKTQIGIVGCFVPSASIQALISTWLLGYECGKRRLTVVYDTIPALPFEVAEAARASGATTIGISPATGCKEHEMVLGPIGDGETILYTGRSPSECERMVIDSSDIVIFAGGDLGALPLFQHAAEQGKTIGVLVGTGGLADDMGTLSLNFMGGNGGVLVNDIDPGLLIDTLIGLSRTRNMKPLHQARTAVMGRPRHPKRMTATNGHHARARSA